MDQNKTFDQQLLDRSYTQDTFRHETALNTNRLDPRIKALSSFIAGRPIAVTYYSQRHNYTAKKSNIADFNVILNNAHRVLVRINNLEIRLGGELDISFDDETNEVSVSGKGFVFPDFSVNIGDIFLYEALPGQLAMFIISNVVPMTWHRQAVNEVSFVMKEFVSNERLSQFDKCTVEIYYFDKKRIWDGASTVLLRDDYITLQNVIKVRDELVKFMLTRYYIKDYRSYFRPDGVYDPYVVAFLRTLISTADTTDYPPIQLWAQYAHRGSDIWSYISRKDKYFLNTMLTGSVQKKCQYSILSSAINSLHNKFYIELCVDDNSDSVEPYALSRAYYNGDITNMSIVEQYLHTYNTTNQVTPNFLIDYIKNGLDLDSTVTFYETLVILFLFNVVIRTM